MAESLRDAYERASADLRSALEIGAHDVGIRRMKVRAARSDWVEQAAWAVVDCEDDLEDALADLRKALEVPA